MICKEGQVYEIPRKWTSALGSHSFQCPDAEIRLAFQMKYYTVSLQSAMHSLRFAVVEWPSVTSREIVYNTDTAYDTVVEPESSSGRISDGRINSIKVRLQPLAISSGRISANSSRKEEIQQLNYLQINTHVILITN